MTGDSPCSESSPFEFLFTKAGLPFFAAYSATLITTRDVIWHLKHQSMVYGILIDADLFVTGGSRGLKKERHRVCRSVCISYALNVRPCPRILCPKIGDRGSVGVCKPYRSTRT